MNDSKHAALACDVFIVGGGLVGLSLGIGLAGAGLDVVVAD
ncbi:MAG: FAD-binding oxidoreductase, partial [Alphaproteobacteria bacterium]